MTIYKDVDGKQYTEKQALKAIPKGCYCYKIVGKPDKNGQYKTKLCPFLDWLKRNNITNLDDFQGTGFCHYLQKGDWFDEETGKEEEHINLERCQETLVVNSKQEGTMLLWDSVKECGINEESPENDEQNAGEINI